MLQIYDGRSAFWQWDINQRLIVDDNVCCEVHFDNKTLENALICSVYEYDGVRVVDVPNILLQSCRPIIAYAFVREANESYTKVSTIFKVDIRAKPDDYVYTETETLCYSSLDKRLSILENAGGVSLQTDDTLVFRDGLLCVNTTDVAEADNSRPMSSAGVMTQLGNIEVLLKTI